MATQFIDGDILASSFIATIAGEDYIVNALNLLVPQISAERNDEKGSLAAKMSKRNEREISGTCELQISSQGGNNRIQFETFDIPAEMSPMGFSLSVSIESEVSNVVVNETRTRTASIRLIGKGEWILASGTWDDLGAWDDSASWIDSL